MRPISIQAFDCNSQLIAYEDTICNLQWVRSDEIMQFVTSTLSPTNESLLDNVNEDEYFWH